MRQPANAQQGSSACGVCAHQVHQAQLVAGMCMSPCIAAKCNRWVRGIEVFLSACLHLLVRDQTRIALVEESYSVLLLGVRTHNEMLEHLDAVVRIANSVFDEGMEARLRGRRVHLAETLRKLLPYGD